MLSLCSGDSHSHNLCTEAVLSQLSQPQVTITVSGRCRVLTGRKRRGWHSTALHCLLCTWGPCSPHTTAPAPGVTSWSRNRAGACSTAALQQCGHSPLLTLPSSAVSGPKHGVSTVVAAGSQGSGAGHRDASATSLQPPVQSSGSGEGRRGWRQSI